MEWFMLLMGLFLAVFSVTMGTAEPEFAAAGLAAAAVLEVGSVVVGYQRNILSTLYSMTPVEAGA
jgi:hypothetical protein